MFRPPRDRQTSATYPSHAACASMKRGGRFHFLPILVSFGIIGGTIIPASTFAQTANNTIPTGAAIIPTDLPAHASTVQSEKGPLSLLPGTIPADSNAIDLEEIPSLATRYQQTLSGQKPVRRQPARSVVTPAKPTTTPTRALAPTLNASTKPAEVETTMAPVPPIETAMPTGNGVYLIQLGAFRDTITAETYWASFRIRYPELAKSFEKQIVSADLGTRGIYHRLRLAGFDSSERAKQQCRQLIADGTECFATHP